MLVSSYHSNLSIYDRLLIKNKWETDKGCNYDDVNWQNILERSQTVLISTNHRQMRFNIFHRTLTLTPHSLHKINRNVFAMCQRSKVNEGKLLHMFWACPCLDELGTLEVRYRD